MKKKILFAIILSIALCLCACSGSTNNSYFSILFIDVGQGDAALVECDGHYMLLDGGDTTAGNTVYRVLQEKGIQKLDILAVSHLHADHIGGLIKALTYASTIDKTICNADFNEKEVFRKFEHQLRINGSSISVPRVGDTFKLGSAVVEVIDVASQEDNDALVLLITYGQTQFLFTGDIVDAAQTRISDKYANEKDEAKKINLIKMPHHGSYCGTLYRFVRTFMPDYSVISVGTGNLYGHPDSRTLDLLDEAGSKIYRTDINGNILVKSNGKKITITTSK